MNVKVKIGEEVFDVEVGDLSARPVLATIDGETFEVWPEMENSPAAATETAPQPAAPRAAAAPRPAATPRGASPSPCADGTGTTVSAPIPGVIISIAVKPGDKVSKGQELCVLEAMKMKNAIRANRDGQIGTVHAAVGQSVQKGFVLVEYSN
jgi:biotin carboxyl carrier protein